MNLATWSIRKPVPAILFFIIITLLGWRHFGTIPIQENPDFDLPNITVSMSLPGATAATIETEITRKVEDSLANLGKVRHIYSTVTEGLSASVVEFELEMDPQEALTSVTDAVNQLKSVLPQDTLAPTISKTTSSGLPIATYSIEVKGLSPTDLTWFTDNTVAKNLMGLKGISKVVRQGGVDREIQVRVQHAKLIALGLTAADVSRQLALQEVDASAGRADLDGNEQTLRLKGAATLADSLADYPLTFNGGQHVRLGDIAQVVDGPAESRQIALLDGKPVISLDIYRAQGYSAVELGKAVEAKLQQMKAEHAGMEYNLLIDRVARIKTQYNASMQSLWEGAILAIVVVFVFLKDVRATVISAVTLPLSIVPTFFVMDLAGFSINGVTLLALVLVIGVVIDDAIVEIENIVRHLNMGKSPLTAAKEAATEIGMAVIATTFTLIAVFLPTAFMSGVVGKFFKQFGWTAAIAVFISLLVARLLTPLLAAYGLKATGHSHENKPDSRLLKQYLKFLEYVLDHKKTLFAATILFVAGSLWLVKYLPSGFIPAGNRESTQISVELAPGSTLTDTFRVAEKVRLSIKDNPYVTAVFTSIGTGTAASLQGAGSVGEVRKATLTVTFKPARMRPNSTEVEKQLRHAVSAIADARINVGGGQSGERFSMVLLGDDPDVLDRAASSITQEMRTIPGLGNVTASSGLLKNELIIKPDFDRMAQLGVSSQAVAQSIRIATVGDYNTTLPKLNLPERQLYIRVKLDDAQRENLDLIRQMRVSAREGTVPLSSVADIEMGSGPIQLARYDRHRNVTITAELAGMPLSEVNKAVRALPSVIQIPPEVKITDGGEGELLKELFNSFIPAIVMSVVAVYAVMVLLFQAFMQPLTILAALPLAIGGAIGALFVGNYSLSMPSLIGFIMLMGIVTKNSILLVEYAQMMQETQGTRPRDAIREACRMRARPIIMTTIAMVAGMLPIFLGMQGADSSFQEPMAIVVIGGLATSTLLSLLVVPAIYEVVERLTHWRVLKH